MKTFLAPAICVFLLSLKLSGWAATLYVDLNSTSPTAPYSSWATAATNIQVAIDAAVDGDLVLVSNGVYAIGGKVKFGDLTNRVALDKPITVQSVNGPLFTTIRGNGATNGLSAVRCAWITNGATLQGFTLTAGATRTSGDPTNAASGGGVLSLGTNAVVANCLVISNVAANFGAGVFQGVAINSAIMGNRPNNPTRGAVEFATLINSTVVSNWSIGSYQSRHTNSIVYFNSPANYSGGTFSFSCATPLPAGISNISTAPQLFSDGIHLQSTSPCRSAGTNLATGTDIDGQAWANPPPMGCDEWGNDPIIVTQPQAYHDVDPVGFRISVVAAGAEPITCYWTRNGVSIEDDGHFSQSSTTDLMVSEISEQDAGIYQVVVSNAFGGVTSAPMEFAIRFVNAANSAAAAPFTTWSTAATNIQDAINVAGAGDLVLVTNGVYAHGGKVMAGDLNNRVAIDKAIAVRSVNGPWVTTIRGAGATNGTAAVRGAWLTSNARLHGFTITAGATRNAGDTLTLRTGGGVWCASSNAIVSNCIIRSNSATGSGGGFYQGTLRNSYVANNQASPITGGAVANANLINCTIVSNAAFGVVQVPPGVLRVTNSIVYFNLQDYSGGGTFAFTCTTPLAAGTGNITNAPLFQIDGVHLSSSSPCRGAGTNTASGTDLFGQSWATPPSMGCAEWITAPSFEIQPVLSLTNNPGGFAIWVEPDGQEPLTYYWYHDGMGLSNDGHFSGTGTTNLVVRRIRSSDAGNYWVVVSNSFGMATSQVAPLIIHFVDPVANNPFPPFTNWATAAATIQDAIDAAKVGDVVLATNGIYSSGGKVVPDGITANDLLSRVAIDKPIVVMSENGYKHTIIEGQHDPISKNGPLAVRGVWMTNGAVLIGFTIRNGATRGGTEHLFNTFKYGGGIRSLSTNALIMNCLLTNNTARYAGGGAASGTLQNTIITGNSCDLRGGGTSDSNLRNCTVYYNFVGAVFGTGAGILNGTVRNSIAVQNYNTAFPSSWQLANYSGTVFSYSCSAPLPSGVGNIDESPYFVDADFHLPAQSPCRGVGSALYAAGEDMDGEVWANPPSMGADEVVDANLTGPITLSINSWETNTLAGQFRRLQFWDSITGRVSRIDWDFGDGLVLTNVSYYASHAWTNPGNYTVTSTAYNFDNPMGVSASIGVEVLPLIQPLLQLVTLTSNGLSFSFEAQSSARYDVQYATNLAPPVVWQGLQTIHYSPGGTTWINDPAWTNSARFYRVVGQ